MSFLVIVRGLERGTSLCDHIKWETPLVLLRVVITVRTLEDFAILRLESWREREVRALCSHGQQAEREAP